VNTDISQGNRIHLISGIHLSILLNNKNQHLRGSVAAAEGACGMINRVMPSSLVNSELAAIPKPGNFHTPVCFVTRILLKEDSDS